MRDLGYREGDSRPNISRNLVDWVVNYFSPRRGLQRTRARLIQELAAMQYRSAEDTRLRADWIFNTTDPTASSSERSTIRERSRDANRNDAVASGATETMAINIVGQGLQLQSRIRGEYLGVSDARAKELQRQAEHVWQIWKPYADSTTMCDFDELQFLALRKIVEDGEIIALPIMVKEEWRPLQRAVELIECDRLVNHQSTLTLSGVDSAVETGPRGEPKAYWIEKAAAGPGDKLKSTRIEARDKRGRPKVLHVFPQKRPGQLRGVPWFAPVLTLFKDLSDTMEAEVVAARIAACLAVFITMDHPEYAQYGASSGTESDTGHRLQTLEPGLINYLKPGESIHELKPDRPGDQFAPFVETVIRMIGISLNLPYELISKDFSKTNYSSARAAILEGRRMFNVWRAWFGRKFCQPLYDLVLEEAYLRGQFDAQDFYELRHEYTRAQWIGGGWGWVDPVKEVEASRKAIDFGLSTLAEEAAAQGRDWEELLEQQKREQDKTRELGIELFHAVKKDADTQEASDATTQEE